MDINCYIITEEQRQILRSSVNGLIRFEPISDINGNYLILEDEYLTFKNMINCPTDLLFIKELVSSIYVPKIEAEL